MTTRRARAPSACDSSSLSMPVSASNQREFIRQRPRWTQRHGPANEEATLRLTDRLAKPSSVRGVLILAVVAAVPEPVAAEDKPPNKTPAPPPPLHPAARPGRDRIAQRSDRAARE